MHRKAQRIRLLALLLGVIFLGAQFHFCAESFGAPAASHLCPVCLVAGSIVASPSLSIAIIPASNRLEIAPMVLSIFYAASRSISPRAPPAS